MHKTLSIIFSLFVSFTFLGCSGGGGDSEPSFPESSEKWAGIYRTSERFNFSSGGGIALQMDITAESLRGSYETSAGGTGTFSGTRSNNQITIKFDQTQGCYTNLEGRGTVSEDESDINIILDGSSCGRTFDNGPARLIKLPVTPSGTDFTGTYFGMNFNDTGLMVSVQTDDSFNFQGNVWILKAKRGPLENFELGQYDSTEINLLSSPVSGVLGNADGECSSYCYTRLYMADINIESNLVPTPLGYVTILDAYTNGDTRILRTSWAYENSGNGGVLSDADSVLF